MNNGAALMYTLQNTLQGYQHVLARPVGSRETHRILRDLVTSLLTCLTKMTVKHILLDCCIIVLFLM